MQITQIKPRTLDSFTLKRVAAYARVSADKTEAEHSLSQQVSYYKNYILSQPGWRFVEVYADDGISGTKEDRPGFVRMMEDARAGKIDVIVTKSITRFARNTVVLLKSIRELKLLDVDVVFEKEHINTMSANGELMLSLLAMYAEEEAKSASDSARWSIEKRFKKGIPTYTRMYGYEWVDGDFVIIPEEAEIVREIFKLYLDGYGRHAICKKLNGEGKSIWGRPWQPGTLHKMLQNEKYTGDMILQKTKIEDFRTKKRVINDGRWQKYKVTNSHEPIIPKETFEAVQAEMKARSGHKGGNHGDNPNLFSGIVKCGECKGSYIHKKKRNVKVPYDIWVCRTAFELGKEYCRGKQIRESILIQKTKEVLGLDEETELTREIILNDITAIESAADNRLRFFCTDGSVKVVPWENPSRALSWTPEMKEQARKDALKRQKGEKK